MGASRPTPHRVHPPGIDRGDWTHHLADAIDDLVMCLLVWVGSQRPLDRVIVEGEAAIQVEDVPADDPVRAHLGPPCIAYVGAYEGVVSVTEAVALEGALLAQEREELHQSQRSRAALHRLVVDAALHGEVELVAFWAGEQAAPLVQVEARDAAWLIEHLVPFVERTKYLVPACAPLRGSALP